MESYPADPGRRRPPAAQVRSGQAAAHATSRPACAAQARTRSWPSGSTAAPVATAVCEPSCGSTPIITAATSHCFSRRHLGEGPQRACLISDLPGVRACFEPRHGENRQADTSLPSQAANGRQAHQGASPSDL